MKINILRYILVLVLEVPGGRWPNQSLVGPWPISFAASDRMKLGKIVPHIEMM